MTQNPQLASEAPAIKQSPDLRFAPTRFDRLVMLIVAGLIGAILLTILLGDNVGVRVLRTAPLDTARSTTPITVQFGEAMNRETVETRLRLESESGESIDGAFSWISSTVFFRPTQALHPGDLYTAILEAGGESESGRVMLNTQTSTFTIQQPRVAYIAPADSVPQNIWFADPSDPDAATQITFSMSGILNFDVSPDGTQIAFTERDAETGGAEIMLLDLERGMVQQVTDCADSSCMTPAWRPDGQMIAYERINFNSDLSSVGISPSRVWLIDLTTTPPSTYPLFTDLQTLGHSPEWSADGKRIAVYDSNTRGILIHDFEADSVLFIPTQQGMVGTFSPDSKLFAFSEIVLMESMARNQTQIADLETSRITALYDLTEPIDDGRMLWTPDGQSLTISRRYLDSSDWATSGRQLFSVNPQNGAAQPLVFDPDYYHSNFEWDPSGEQIVMHRILQNRAEISESSAPIRPEIWTYDTSNDALTQIAHNAYFPRWVP